MELEETLRERPGPWSVTTGHRSISVLVFALLLRPLYKSHFTVGTYEHKSTRDRWGSALAAVSGLPWGSWDVHPHRQGEATVPSGAAFHLWARPRRIETGVWSRRGCTKLTRHLSRRDDTGEEAEKAGVHGLGSG